MRERAVAGQRVDLEVDALSLDDIRVTVRDQLRDQPRHLLDPFGGSGLVVGPQDVQTVERAPKRHLEPRNQRGLGGALLVGPGDDLVLDVGDVAHELHRVSAPDEITPDRVEHDLLATVTEMRNVVRGRAADVHRHASFDARHEVDLRPHRGVVEPQHRPRLIGAPRRIPEIQLRARRATAQTAIPSERPIAPKPSPRFGRTAAPIPKPIGSRSGNSARTRFATIASM